MSPFRERPKHVIIGVDCMLLRVFSPFEKKAMKSVLHSAVATPKAVTAKKKAMKSTMKAMKRTKLAIQAEMQFMGAQVRISESALKVSEVIRQQLEARLLISAVQQR